MFHCYESGLHLIVCFCGAEGVGEEGEGRKGKEEKEEEGKRGKKK